DALLRYGRRDVSKCSTSRDAVHGLRLSLSLRTEHEPCVTGARLILANNRERSALDLVCILDAPKKEARWMWPPGFTTSCCDRTAGGGNQWGMSLCRAPNQSR